MRLAAAFFVAAGLGCLAATACARPMRRTASPMPDTITAQQMIRVNAQTVWEGVMKLRPAWFASRGPRSLTDNSPTLANVAVGGQVVGDIEYLRNLRPEDVSFVTYHHVGEGSMRFGMNNPGGVIEVVFITPRGGGG